MKNYKITTLNEYGYRGIREYPITTIGDKTFEMRSTAERDFLLLQNNKNVFITFYEDDKPVKYAEKINLKWYVSEVK